MIEGLRLFDADNHYYEAPDAFTRYLDPAMARRSIQWVQLDGRRRLMIGGKLNRFLGNPNFDPIARPGSLMEYFRAENTAGTEVRELFGALEPLADHPEYTNRDARIAAMDSQGLDSALMFPTLGVLVQQALVDDVDALHATYHAFNQWLEEDWGFAYDDRIYAAPVIPLADPDLALAEVNWAIEHGARILCVIPGPVPNRHGGSRSPAARDLDPVWARIEEADLPIGLHGTDKILDRYISQWEEPNRGFAVFSSTFNMVVSHGRPIFDTMAAMICHGLFDRFPNLRVATIETGSHWVGHFLQELDSVYGKRPQEFSEPPVETFLKHVWVAPFFEDDMSDLKDLIGADRIIFGSDWPHAEGLALPADFEMEIKTFADEEKSGVMGDNVRTLMKII